CLIDCPDFVHNSTSKVLIVKNEYFNIDLASNMPTKNAARAAFFSLGNPMVPFDGCKHPERLL
ncbi:MAG TPA: hypothetical protein PKI50_11600, partial [Bacillota bacterium]|nr:hypothetical protein [Bacillota bacterium]